MAEAVMESCDEPGLEESGDDCETDSSSVPSTISSSSLASRNLVQKKNTKSDAWKYFGFIPDENGQSTEFDSPKCKICLQTVVAKCGNTSNLFTHLRTFHPKEYNNISETQSTSTKCPRNKRLSKSSGQLTIQESIQQTKKYNHGSKEHKMMTKSIATFLAKEMLPIYLVDKPGFREMISVINPRYDLPHKDHFSRLAIPRLYEDTRHNLESKLASSSAKSIFFFSSTSDLWSSRTSDPFLVYTIHYIDSN
uniref:BED-type domain-containing protein n=1 Tax=Amphimedon queenslandica TaxID=400682 RepID=A0A1X7UNU5_AMPQE